MSKPLMCSLVSASLPRTLPTSTDSSVTTKVQVVESTSHLTSEMPSTLVKSPRTEAAQPIHVMFGSLRTTCWPSAAVAVAAAALSSPPVGASPWQPKTVVKLATTAHVTQRFMEEPPSASTLRYIGQGTNTLLPPHYTYLSIANWFG